MNDSTGILEPLVKPWAVLLTTYKRGWTPVGTAVNIVVEGDLAYFRTWDTAWKLKRIRNNPGVEFAPSTALGRPTGPAIQAHARVLEEKSRPAPEGCSPAIIRPCTASWSRSRIASG